MPASPPRNKNTIKILLTVSEVHKFMCIHGPCGPSLTVSSSCLPPMFTYPSPPSLSGMPVIVQKQLVIEPFPTGSTVLLTRALMTVLLPLLVFPRKTTFIRCCLVASTIVNRLARILEEVLNTSSGQPWTPSRNCRISSKSLKNSFI